MKAIGGYPEIELPSGCEYHADALRLNTARNALECVLRARGYKKIYLPRYTCEALYEPLDRLNIKREFYGIDLRLDPSEMPDLGDGEAIVYTDYFGIKSDTMRRLAGIYGVRLIADNAQAFYARPLAGTDTIYSPRKFFGVADGGYLYSAAVVDTDFPRDESYARMTAQLKRADLSAEAGYEDFKQAENQLCCQEIKEMSDLTRKIISSVAYDEVRDKRVRNYRMLHERLGERNAFDAALPEGAVPMTYPFYSGDCALRERLVREKIFVHLYWPNVLEETAEDSTEHKLARHMLALPVSQTCGESDMNRIIEVIRR